MSVVPNPVITETLDLLESKKLRLPFMKHAQEVQTYLTTRNTIAVNFQRTLIVNSEDTLSSAQFILENYAKHQLPTPHYMYYIYATEYIMDKVKCYESYPDLHVFEVQKAITSGEDFLAVLAATHAGKNSPILISGVVAKIKDMKTELDSWIEIYRDCEEKFRRNLNETAGDNNGISKLGTQFERLKNFKVGGLMSTAKIALRRIADCQIGIGYLNRQLILNGRFLSNELEFAWINDFEGEKYPSFRPKYVLACDGSKTHYYPLTNVDLEKNAILDAYLKKFSNLSGNLILNGEAIKINKGNNLEKQLEETKMVEITSFTDYTDILNYYYPGG